MITYKIDDQPDARPRILLYTADGHYAGFTRSFLSAHNRIKALGAGATLRNGSFEGIIIWTQPEGAK